MVDLLIRLARIYVAATVLVVAALLGITRPAFAQGPEESCGVPYTHPNYSDIALIDEPIDALHGWAGDLDVDGNACFGHRLTGGSGEYFKIFTTTVLPDYHNAVNISLHATTSAARNGHATIRLGGAQETEQMEWPSGSNLTNSDIVAQGIVLTREIRIYAVSNGTMCLENISAVPTENIDTGSSAFADPHFDGVDYPVFYDVISTTSIVEFTSRVVGGELWLREHRNHPFCTPVRVNVVSDTLQLRLHGRESRPGTGGRIRAAVVDELADVLSAEWGPLADLPSNDIFTVTAKINNPPPGGGLLDGFFCFDVTSLWTGDEAIDDFSPVVCPQSPTNDCPTLTNADFTTTDAWSITSTASIADGSLHLPNSGDYATQPIAITEDAYYNVVLTATGATSGTDRLLVSLGGNDSVLILSDTLRSYTTLISAMDADTISPALRLENLTGGSEIDYICFTRAYTTNETIVCIAPENGAFEDNSVWSFYHGGQWNASEENALLPIEVEGIVSQTVTLPILPNVDGGNYWILSFDAKSRYGDGAAYVSLDGQDFTDSMTFTLGTAFQRYEADASAYQESTWGLFFANLNIPGYITSESDVLIDNVCIHWSPDPPADPPPPRGPPQIRDIPTITLTIDITCAEVSTWLSDTIGVDLPALETEEPPDDLDIFGTWIWWLASKLWLYAAKPIICFLLFLWNLLAGMLETIINFLIVNFLNPLLHTINDLMLWLYAIYLFIITFANDPFGSLKAIIKEIWEEYIWPILEPIVNWFKAIWDDVIWPVLQPWLQPLIDAILNLWDWIQNTLWPWLHDLWIDPLGTIGALISNMLQTLIDWLFDMLRPVWDVFQWILWVLARFVGIVALILWPLWWAWDFERALIAGLIDAITNASQIAPLELGDFAIGYDFINGVIASTPLGAFVLIVNGVLWFVFIRWAIGQFSNLNT